MPRKTQKQICAETGCDLDFTRATSGWRRAALTQKIKDSIQNNNKKMLGHLVKRHIKNGEEKSFVDKAALFAAKTGKIKMFDSLVSEHHAIPIQEDNDDNHSTFSQVIRNNQTDMLEHLVLKYHVNIYNKALTTSPRYCTQTSFLWEEAMYFFSLIIKKDFFALKNFLERLPEKEKNRLIHWPVNDGSDTTSPALPTPGKTALQWAFDNKNFDIMTLLLTHGACPKKDLTSPPQEEAEQDKIRGLTLALARNNIPYFINNITVYNDQVLMNYIINTRETVNYGHNIKKKYCYNTLDLQLLIEGLEKGELSVTENGKIVPKRPSVDSPEKEYVTKWYTQTSLLNLLTHPIQLDPQKSMSHLTQLVKSMLNQDANNSFDNIEDNGDLLVKMLGVLAQLKKDNSELKEQLASIGSVCAGGVGTVRSTPEKTPKTCLTQNQAQEQTQPQGHHALLFQKKNQNQSHDKSHHPRTTTENPELALPIKKRRLI